MLTNNPIWDIVKTGASFIPGIGSAVSAGMASAAAFGRGESLADIGLAAARGALPAAAQVGLDIALGAMKKHGLGALALQALRHTLPPEAGEAAKGAFDAAVAIHTKASPDAKAAMRARMTPQARAAFDAAVHAHSNPPARPVFVQAGPTPRGGRTNVVRMPSPVRPPNHGRPFPSASYGANKVASMLLANPHMRSSTALELANTVNASSDDARAALTALLRRYGAQLLGHQDVGAYDSLDTAARRAKIALPVDLGMWPSAETSIEVMRLPPIGVTRRGLHHLYRRGDHHMKRAILAHELFAHMARNTGELVGTSWKIESGDIPSKVAQTVVGDASRWKEITSVNPTMTVYTDANGATQLKGWTVGKTIQLPPSWFPSSIPAAVASTTDGPPFPSPSQYPHGYPSSVYVVKSGDTGTKIAELITGDGNRWKELLVTNPSKADPKYGIAVYTSDKLTLPEAWRAPQPTVGTVPVPVEVPLPAVGAAPVEMSPGASVLPPSDGAIGTPAIGAPAIGVSPVASQEPAPVPAAAPVQAGPAVLGSQQQIAALEIMLTQFFREHPDATYTDSGAGGFGSAPGDMSGTWTPRVQDAVMAFQKWWNGKGLTPTLQTDGLPDANTAEALTVQTHTDGGASAGPAPVASRSSGAATAPSAPAPAAASSSGGGLGAALAIGLPIALTLLS